MNICQGSVISQPPLEPHVRTQSQVKMAQCLRCKQQGKTMCETDDVQSKTAVPVIGRREKCRGDLGGAGTAAAVERGSVEDKDLDQLDKQPGICQEDGEHSRQLHRSGHSECGRAGRMQTIPRRLTLLSVVSLGPGAIAKQTPNHTFA